jgi:hypothetical protein
MKSSRFGQFCRQLNDLKSQRWDLNPQPSHYECDALPIEATLAFYFIAVCPHDSIGPICLEPESQPVRKINDSRYF